MLTLYDFNGLAEDEKANAVWSGTFLADREENTLKIQLYYVNSFYVEVFYDSVAHRILRFRAFASRNLLTPYLAQIKLML